MKKIRLTLQYDGTAYSGWQVQKKDTTIQGTIEDAIFKVTNEKSRVTGAARTDAGVHAFQQIAAFSTSSQLEPHLFAKALNANLPYDVRITEASKCPEDFHPRYDAKNKTYSYIISQTGNFSVFLKRYSWQLPYQLNLQHMKKAAGYLAGRHDFSSFRASGCNSKHPVREISSIGIKEVLDVEFIAFRLSAPVIKIHIKANAFLRHMARNIIGTIVECGRGRIVPQKMQEILEAKDRQAAGPAAPACGLFLEDIVY